MRVDFIDLFGLKLPHLLQIDFSHRRPNNYKTNYPIYHNKQSKSNHQKPPSKHQHQPPLPFDHNYIIFRSHVRLCVDCR